MGIPILDTILDVVKGPLDKLIPDKGKKAEFRHALEMEILRTGLAQMEINKTEAKHLSVFVAGWRPFIGWVCGFALMWHFMGFDILNWVRVAFFPEAPEPPALGGSETLVTVLLSMLGLGGLRTVEKLKGVSRER
ncbi:3TM-type holin [Kordiimonas laminariae]|uniref:3TM-type holin n=1 Tax=Kordiimonas laminariae TaxID=2917717 RepID=UPI001FF64E9C|nr:3TM-type holin [Kordiimonas laminariae]MCK0068024.1 holin family protein [Kordiimonas laminariae]